jgi:hypothetical protein
LVGSAAEPSGPSNSSDHASSHPGGPPPPDPVVTPPDPWIPPEPSVLVVVVTLEPPLPPDPLLDEVDAVDPESLQAGSVIAAVAVATTPARIARERVEK